MSEAGQSDGRKPIYETLHAQQLQAQKDENEYSSSKILEFLFKSYRPNSVLDVGCGLGTWLRTAAGLGVSEVRGVEGEWLNPSALEISPELVQTCDLEKGFDLGRKFDLVICLEVAEHLSEDAADRFIATLVRHAPAVLFSAAIPLQGGEHHVNERYLPYWVAKFAEHGFRPLDFIRSEIWDDGRVIWWLQQNIMLFAHDELIARNESFRQESLAKRGPLSLVHPNHFTLRAKEIFGLNECFAEGGLFEVRRSDFGSFTVMKADQRMETMGRLLEYIKTGGYFHVTVSDSGQITVTKVEPTPAPAPQTRSIIW